MKKIEEIDKNFLVKDAVIKEGTAIYNVCDAPFSIHGVFLPDSQGEKFYRINPKVAERVSEGVNALNTNCAGGRVRFKTDSSYIAIKAVMSDVGKMPHFALTGSAGFDLYSGKEHLTTFQPKFNITAELFGEYYAKDSKLKEYTLNLPLYSAVKELYVVLDEGADLKAPSPYKNEKPVVFYGSSITQGGCASRPGTAYPSIISRNLDLDYINLGFSGSAKGETEIAEYIASLDMEAFIFDYDHNAHSADELINTHERFIKIIRKAQPNLPIICMTEPVPYYENYSERKQIIENNVLNAKEEGDKNIYFIDMTDYISGKGVLNEASVDKCHPNDLGFYFMAEAVEKTIKQFL